MKKLNVLVAAVISVASFSSVANITHELATTCAWEFGRTDGSVISPRMSLTKIGTVSGYSHQNESSWEVNAGDLIFKDSNGAVSTRFNKVEITAQGSVKLLGDFLLIPEYNVVHTLTCHK